MHASDMVVRRETGNGDKGKTNTCVKERVRERENVGRRGDFIKLHINHGVLQTS